MIKNQRIISRIIIGSVLVSLLIFPVLGVDFTVTILPENLQIVSTDPSALFNLYVDESRLLRITVNRPATTIWYVNGSESYTTFNSTTSSYYFTASNIGIINITAISNNSLSEVSYTWFVTVSELSPPYEGSHAPCRPPVRPAEEITDQVWVNYPEGKEVPEMKSIMDDVDVVLIGLGLVFSLFFLYTICRNDEDKNSPHREPPKR